MGTKIPVWKTALNQNTIFNTVRLLKAINFIIKEKIFNNEIYNILSNNPTVNHLIQKYENIKINIKMTESIKLQSKFKKIQRRIKLFSISKKKLSKLKVI